MIPLPQKSNPKPVSSSSSEISIVNKNMNIIDEFELDELTHS